MKRLTTFLLNIYVERVLAIVFLLLAIFIFQGQLFTFFLVFIFSYLFWEGLQISQKYLRRHKIKISDGWILSFMYLLFLGILFFTLASIIPKIISEVQGFNLKDIIEQTNWVLKPILEPWGMEVNIEKLIKSKMSISNITDFSLMLKAFGAGMIQSMLALLFSFIYLLEKTTIHKLVAPIEHTIFRTYYQTYRYLVEKFVVWFGYIFKAQFLIAFFNTILTAIGLLLLGGVMQGSVFPYLSTLLAFVFFFGFIPVLWTFLSSIPILFIGYTFGGMHMILYIILLICVIHALEAYYLNPKIVGKYIHYPVFLTLVILYISEHTFWPIGLIIGVPIFVITVSMLKDLNEQYKNETN